MSNLFFIQNILFLTFLYFTTQTKTNKNNFLSFSLQGSIKNSLRESTIDENFFDLISEYRKKLLESTIFSEIINNDNKNNQKENKILKNNLLRSVLIQNVTKEINDNEVFFDTTEFIWENIQTFGDAPSPRRGFSMIIADTFLVIFGGSDLNGNFYNDVFYFDLTKNTWMRINSIGSIPKPRADHSAILYGTTMWIFGGASREGYLNDLYSLDIETVINIKKEV